MYVQFVIAINCQLSLKEFCLHLSTDSPTRLYPSQLTHNQEGGQEWADDCGSVFKMLCTGITMKAPCGGGAWAECEWGVSQWACRVCELREGWAAENWGCAGLWQGVTLGESRGLVCLSYSSKLCFESLRTSLLGGKQEKDKISSGFSLCLGGWGDGNC